MMASGIEGNEVNGRSLPIGTRRLFCSPWIGAQQLSRGTASGGPSSQTDDSTDSATDARTDQGFSLLEALLCIAIMIPIMGAAVGLFLVGVNHHAAEQSSIDASQEARAGMEMMTGEIAQAGSHGDVDAALTANVVAGTVAAAAQVTSSSGFTVGDFIEVDTGANREVTQATAVASGAITAIYRLNHAAGTPVRLFAQPYLAGVIPPSGVSASSSTTQTFLRFFGDILSNSTVHYVEYVYDAENAQITRSITPVTASSKGAALPFIRNVVPGSVRFTLNTDTRKVVTSVDVAVTVRNSVKSGAGFQQTALGSRVLIPSAVAASMLRFEQLSYGGIDRLPPTPTIVTQWATQ